MNNERPLSHIRVLDFGQYLAGPLVGMMLADMGAEVIRIDPPDGPRFKSPASDMLSRGKRSLRLDLKYPKDKQTALELIKRSDVLIENFRPGVMSKLELGPDNVHRINKQLIYLSLPGFASTDTDLAHMPAWEAVIAAFTGQFTDMGLNRRLMGINPSFTPLALASAYGATFGAMSVLFALSARNKNGGDWIEVPLASALLEGLAYNCEQIENYPERYKSPREIELERRQLEGLPLNLNYSELSEFLDPFYRTYTCADGRGFYVVSGSVKSHPRRVLETLGLHQLLSQLPDFDAYLDSQNWPNEWALSNYPVGVNDRTILSNAMKQAFLTRSSHEWEELFGTAKAPATAQRSTKEWLSDPHALASGLILEINDPRYGKMRQMGNVAWLAEDKKSDCKLPGPLIDNLRTDLDKILKEPLRSISDTLNSNFYPSKNEGWLQGLKVLDLTNVIAGPTIGSTLVRFGAKVTHVQPVKPSVDPWNTIVFGIHAHRGKKSILLDLASVDGKRVLKQLISESDVITMNGTDAQRDSLGLSQDHLKTINPKLILVQLDAFGGPRRGPKSDHLGYDDLAQAATGVMLRFGGGMETPEEHAHFGTIDVLTGYCACVALGGALLNLQRHGKGSTARASLAAAGNLIQAPFMYDFDNREIFNEPSGRKSLGWGPFYHCYKAADGWFFFAAPIDQYSIFQTVPELSDLNKFSTGNLTDILAERFQQKPFTYWEQKLCKSSSVIVRLASLLKTRDAALQIESSGSIDIEKSTFRVIRHDSHPMGRWCDLVAPNAIRTQTSKITIPEPMQKYGAQTRNVLLELGYKISDIEIMIASGSAGESWSEKYLPE